MYAALVFVGGSAFGVLIIRYPRWFYGNISTLPFFERWVGGGGGYTGWRFIGMIVIVFSWIAAFKYF
jgi:hypothetical protein